MEKSCKIQFYPTSSQLDFIQDIFDACRCAKNLYIEYNKRNREEGGKFISGYDFSKAFNKLKKKSEKYKWIRRGTSKAIKDAIMSEEKAFISFFKKHNGYPRFHARKRITKESYFFIKDGISFDYDSDIIKIPILGKVRVTEKDYLPDISTITSGRVIREYDKYYLIFLYTTEKQPIETNDFSIGIDVGVKNYASIAYSNGEKPVAIKHFKDKEEYKALESKKVRLQQIISHKVEINYGRKLNVYLDKHHGEEPDQATKNKMKGESYDTSQIRRLRKKIRSCNRRMSNIRRNYIFQLVNYITARTKPSVITIEDLQVSEMIKHNGTKDATLHKYIQESSFYFFRTHLINKCEYYGIKLRIADKYFASSKTCCCCGKKKEHLTLSDRIFKCDYCPNEMDRDLNAAYNLLDLKDKKCNIITA